ncbi:MAG: hypothetical protein CND43_01680 [Flavobacteriales bacterium MED-G15]|nr:MAG: hypothetical protein CND43_01680 [Flavobacteriales bacterium MED-G15]
MFKKIRFLLLLIPLGILIRFVDLKVTQDDFLSTNELSDHYLFIGGLVVIVIGLLAAVLYFDKKSNT